MNVTEANQLSTLLRYLLHPDLGDAPAVTSEQARHAAAYLATRAEKALSCSLGYDVAEAWPAVDANLPTGEELQQLADRDEGLELCARVCDQWRRGSETKSTLIPADQRVVIRARWPELHDALETLTKWDSSRPGEPNELDADPHLRARPALSDDYGLTLRCAHADCGTAVTIAGVPVRCLTLTAAREVAARSGWSVVFDETDLSMADLCPAHPAPRP